MNVGDLIEKFPLPDRPIGKLTIAILGAGRHFRESHLPSIVFMRSVGWPLEIVAVCDREREARNQVLDVFPDAEEYSDSGVFLKVRRADVLMICTWPPDSADLCEQALEFYPSIFVEKPVSHDTCRLEHLDQLAESRDVVIQVGYNRRYQPLGRLLQNLTKGFSRVVHANVWFHRSVRNEPDFYKDTLGHPIDFLLSQFGDFTLKQVKVIGSNHNRELSYGVDFVLGSDSFDAKVEVRPAIGCVKELYEFQCDKQIVSLQYAVVQFEIESRSELFVGDGETRRMIFCDEVDSRKSPETRLFFQGFVHQIAEFVKLHETRHYDGQCNLESATRVWKMVNEIISSVHAAV